MSMFSFPIRPVADIKYSLELADIASINPSDLVSPTPDFIRSILLKFISYCDPESENPMEAQLEFASLQRFQNPDEHEGSMRIINLYCKANKLLGSIGFNGFTLRDLLQPQRQRTEEVLSAIANYIFHREDKFKNLEEILDVYASLEEQKVALEARISELNKQISDIEEARKMEEPSIKEVEAEVRQLKHTIQSYNKQQLSMKATFNELKDKSNAIKEKIAQADFELNKVAQENSRLSAKVVQSPDKIQSALEEKKSTCDELKKTEKLAFQSVQEKNTTLEVYSKVYAKMSKHFSWMQTIQEQVNSTKTVEKDVKALKAKLNEDEVIRMNLDAKLAERQGKAKQLEELIKFAEKEKDNKQADGSQKVEACRREMEWKLQLLEPRERRAEDLVAKGESLRSDANSVREIGKAREEELRAKLEQVIDEFHNYSKPIHQKVANVTDL